MGRPPTPLADRAQRGEMQRTVARVLVLVLLVGMYGPLALAVSSPVSPAHCQRQPATEKPAHHHCHEGMVQSAEIPEAPATLKNSDCCINHECCRSLVRSQWAHFSLTLVPLGIILEGAIPSQPRPLFQSFDLLSSRPVRAPPVL